MWVRVFSALQALGRLPTAAGTCAALPQAARVDAALFFAAVTTDTVRCNAVFMAETLSIILVAQTLPSCCC